MKIQKKAVEQPKTEASVKLETEQLGDTASKTEVDASSAKTESGAVVSSDSDAESEKKSQANGTPNKRMIYIVIAITVVILVALAGKFIYDFIQRKQYNEEVDAVAAQADDIITEMNRVLTAKAPTTWVYDRDENLIMTLKLSSVLQSVDTVPMQISKAIMQNSERDPAGTIVSEFLLNNSIPNTGATYDGYYQRLVSSYSPEDMQKYLATNSKFGGAYTGLIDATYNYFGVAINKLTDMQLDFLAFAYRNDNVDVDKYLEDNSLTEDRLGLVVHRSDYSAIRAKVLSELEAIEGIDIINTSYMVKLSTSTQQQSILQTIIDSGMRQLIDLNGDKTYAFDCSVAVVDRNSGYVRAFVPGRTSSTVENAKPFTLNALSFRDNFAELYRQLSDKNTFGFALREVTKSNGDKELKSLSELFDDMMLAPAKNEDLIDTIGLMRSMYSMSPDFKGITLIYQVTDSSGMTVYKAPGESMLSFNNDNLCQFFADENNDLTEFGGTINIDTGVVAFKGTADYMFVAIAGSGAVGGSVTSAQRELFTTTINQLQDSIATFYPTPVNAIWDGTGMAEAMTVCYELNQSYVEGLFMDRLDEVSEILIESFATRMEFENAYEDLKNFIDKYEAYVGEEYADSLRAALQSVRSERTDLLVKYSVG